MSEPDRPPPPLVVTLAALTVVSGFVDAVSFLGLGHVFTANMTGNLVLIGFAAAGAPGFSMAANLSALGASSPVLSQADAWRNGFGPSGTCSWSQW